MGLGTGSLFLMNVLLKSQFSAEEYGLYSLLITYISVLESFGLFGLEQVFLRVSKTMDQRVYTNKNVIMLIVMVFLLNSITFSLILTHFYDFEFKSLHLVILTFAITANMFLYNFYRLITNFSTAQSIKNGWKICTFIFLSILMGLKVVFSLDVVFTSIWITSLIICSLVMYDILANRRFLVGKFMLLKNLIYLTSGFCLSLLSMASLSFGDRFIIESVHGPETFGNYFYLSNFFLFPFAFLQGYVGFKELVSFKNYFSFDVLTKKMINTASLSLSMSAFLLITFGLLEFYNIFSVGVSSNIILILLFLLLGNVKMIYTILSAALGAITNNRMINVVNLYGLLAIVSAFLVLFIYGGNFMVEGIVLIFLVLWLVRFYLFYSAISKANIIS